jgi:DeoR/GlpR family transcriptional regulator of sugar metabolism
MIEHALRQNLVYQFIKARRRARTREVAQHLNVSDDTARREIGFLHKQGILTASGSGKSTVYGTRE